MGKNIRPVVHCYCFSLLILLLMGMAKITHAECPADEKQQYISGVDVPEDLFNILNSPWITGSSMGSPGFIFALNSENKFWEELAISYPQDKFDIDKTYHVVSV